jgi:hypothetical protein
MHLVDVVLFLHIATALLAFAIGGIIHAGEWSAHRATTVGELRGSLAVGHKLEPLFPVLLVLLFVFGAWLIHLNDPEFHFKDDWISVSIGAVIVLLVVGGAVLAPRAKRQRESLAGNGADSISPELRASVNDPVLWRFGHFNTGLALAVVFLMTTKPHLLGSLVAVAVGAVAGLAIGSLGRQRALA